jgi:hypothetical protein
VQETDLPKGACDINKKETSNILLHKTHFVYCMVLFSSTVNVLVYPQSGV